MGTGAEPMPTYDYVCEQGHRFEVFQSMKDEPLSACRECGAPAKRLIGPGAGFLFRGDGFYITDYRSKSYQDKAKAETAPKGDAAAPKTDGGAAKGEAPSAAGGGAQGAAGAKKDTSGTKSDRGSSGGASSKPPKPKDPGKGS